ncbi:cytochrome d ubiquinol oxidase subunit II [Mucilaginibacter sp. McL0603]|uniref:cytochrome d ubiquinol oxidase subunit II n=1 Tax=Mucilaginibacter sp. McL0603 TaxID=3415670 RepID=UPI003CE9B992
MLYVVIGFLWVSLLIYLLMGGADYGSGILELFTSEKERDQIRKTSHHVMGPIWEANHMWLIIAVVIIFVGFPQVYSTVSVFLHIPVVIMLFGIIARGTSFTFRNYDAVKDKMHNHYNRIYMYSSLVTPLFLGIIAGSAVSGRIDPLSVNFSSSYIYDWLNPFSFSVGLFTVSLCGFLAAVFMAGEVQGDYLKGKYVQKAKIMNLAMVLSGSLCLLSSYTEGIPMFRWIFGSFICVTALCLAILSLIIVYQMIEKNKIGSTRFFAGFMVTSLLIAVTYSHFPQIILLKNGTYLSLLGQSVSMETINILGAALLAGSAFILPALAYLIYSFNRKGTEEYQ